MLGWFGENMEHVNNVPDGRRVIESVKHELRK